MRKGVQGADSRKRSGCSQLQRRASRDNRIQHWSACCAIGQSAAAGTSSQWGTAAISAASTRLLAASISASTRSLPQAHRARCSMAERLGGFSIQRAYR